VHGLVDENVVFNPHLGPLAAKNKSKGGKRRSVTNLHS